MNKIEQFNKFITRNLDYIPFIVFGVGITIPLCVLYSKKRLIDVIKIIKLLLII